MAWGHPRYIVRHAGHPILLKIYVNLFGRHISLVNGAGVGGTRDALWHAGAPNPTENLRKPTLSSVFSNWETYATIYVPLVDKKHWPQRINLRNNWYCWYLSDPSNPSSVFVGSDCVVVVVLVLISSHFKQLFWTLGCFWTPRHYSQSLLHTLIKFVYSEEHGGHS